MERSDGYGYLMDTWVLGRTMDKTKIPHGAYMGLGKTGMIKLESTMPADSLNVGENEKNVPAMVRP